MLDSNNNPVPTYNQADVTKMAKLLTGWTYPTAPGATAKDNNPAYYIGQMFSVDAEHDKTAKTIFGNVTIPAGQTAEQDLDVVLAALMAQPTMAPFISQQLIQHLVTSNPSPGLHSARLAGFRKRRHRRRRESASRDHRDPHDPEARAGDDPTATMSRNLRPHARADSVHGQRPARLERHRRRDQHASPPTRPNMGEELFNAGSVFSYFSPQSQTEHGLLGPGVPDLLDANRGRPRRYGQFDSLRHQRDRRQGRI